MDEKTREGGGGKGTVKEEGTGERRGGETKRSPPRQCIITGWRSLKVVPAHSSFSLDKWKDG